MLCYFLLLFPCFYSFFIPHFEVATPAQYLTSLLVEASGCWKKTPVSEEKVAKRLQLRMDECKETSGKKRKHERRRKRSLRFLMYFIFIDKNS